MAEFCLAMVLAGFVLWGIASAALAIMPVRPEERDAPEDDLIDALD